MAPVTGANKGQGFALCRRILAEHTDTRVFLCSRDAGKGQVAAAKLAAEFRGARLCLNQWSLVTWIKRSKT